MKFFVVFNDWLNIFSWCYSLTRVQESSAMQRYARSWPRTRHPHRLPLPPLLPRHPANPCKSSRSTGSRSLGPIPSALQTNRRNLETAVLLVNHYAPSEGLMAKINLEAQGWRFGGTREAWMLANSFPHSGQQDAVAKNRIFPQGHQNNFRKRTL